jgi:hypothetical protein
MEKGVDYLASTWGGFLVGVGLSFLLFSLGVLYAIESYYAPVYEDVMSLKPAIESLYSITHHTLYGFAIDALRWVADAVNWISSIIPRLKGAADKLRNAANFMENARSSAERAYNIVKSMEMFSPERLRLYIVISLVFSIALMSVGGYLIVKARKPLQSLVTT